MSISRNRFAVLFVSAIEILFSLTFVAVGIVLSQTLSNSLTSSESSADSDVDPDLPRLALYLHLLTYVCLLLMSGLGFQGALRRRRKHVSLFFSMTLAQFFLAFGSGVFCLVLLFSSANPDTCSNLDHFSRLFCEHSDLAKALSTALYLQIWVTELISLYFTLSYSQQLLEEEQQTVKDMYEF